jgi:hypothetical protein
MITKPSRRFIAEARSTGDGHWLCYWAFPGMVPTYIGGDQPVSFRTAGDATMAAKLALANALLTRHTTTDLPERYRHMAAADFAGDLREAGITPTRFARVYGVPQSAVMAWINGIPGRIGKSDRIPHSARVLLALFLAYPDAVEVAERVTAENTTPRHEFAEEASLRPG